MPAPDLEYEFSIRVPVAGVPAYPLRHDMWADRGPTPKVFCEFPRAEADWRKRKTAECQAKRVRQAAYCYAVDLIPDRCLFGPRRMVLVGTTKAPHVELAIGTILNAVRWSMWTIYNEEAHRLRVGATPPVLDVALTIRPSRVAA